MEKSPEEEETAVTCLSNELEQVKRHVPPNELISAFPSCVKIDMRRSIVKQLSLMMQFPSEYPTSPLVLELKSKTLPEVLVAKLQSACDKELKAAAGRFHIVEIFNFCQQFLDGAFC